MTEERGRGGSKEPEAEYVRDEAEEATDRELERDSSKESVENEQETGGALPRSSPSNANESK